MTTPAAVTPETLTFEHIKLWDGTEMKRQLAHPEMREAITNIVKNHSLEDVLAAQAEIQARQVAEQVPAEKTVEELAVEEAQRVAAEVEAQRVAAEAEAAKVPKKLVVEYQVKDEEGNPLGRPTHLEATTAEEMIEKMKEAHIQATRAFHRLKKQKITFKEQPPQQIPAQSDAELLSAMKDLKSDDPQKQLEAVRKVQRVESEKVKAESDQKLAEVNELRRQEQVSFQFLARHRNDFNNCQANIELIKTYFMENELAWTLDNLEIAFHALESELAPVAVPVAPAPPVNPVVVTPAVIPATPVAPVAVQPVTPTPVQTAPPANPVAAAPRPGVNGGLVPGQSSATRPVATASKGLSAEEIKSWDGPTMRAKMRNPAIRPQIEAFFAARAQGKK
jgi:hypothetical protein